MKRIYNKKTPAEISADRISNSQKLLYQQVQKIKKLEKEKLIDKEKYNKIKQTIELLTKASGSIGYLGQTHASMLKTVIHDRQLDELNKIIEVFREILPNEIYDKYMKEAKEIVLNGRKSAFNK